MREPFLETFLLVSSLIISCGGPQAPLRPTTASNARSDDAWLLGERCAPDAGADAALDIKVLEEGSGMPVAAGMTVRVRYIASLPDGRVVHDSDNMPSEVNIGSAKTMCGFDRALVGMRPGEQRRVVVPWQLALGDAGRPPDVPPRSDLAFVIDLFLPSGEAVNFGMPPSNPAAPRRR